MRRKISFILAALTLFISFSITPFNAIADDTQREASSENATQTATEAQATGNSPVLLDIGFKNAHLDSKFDPDIFEYTITLDDNTVTPTLESYALAGDANIFITYDSDETNHKTGLTATIEYETGSKKYIFKYSNPPQYIVTGNCNLSDIYVFCGEVYPKLNSEDTSYKLYIPCDMTTLRISPSTEDINAYCVNTTHEITLLPNQTFTVTIKCIASDGSEKDYTFDIKRSHKTTEEVKNEMSQKGYASLVEGTRLYEKPEFILTLVCVIGGVAVILVLYRLTKRIAINPYDKDEKPFYSSVE